MNRDGFRPRPATRRQTGRSAPLASKPLPQPLMQMLFDKRIVVQMRVRLADPVDLFHLAGGQILARVQTPAALQQPLAPQDFVDARATAVKPPGPPPPR